MDDFSRFMDTLVRDYSRPVCPSFAQSYRFAARFSREQGWPVPSQSTARRMLNKKSGEMTFDGTAKPLERAARDRGSMLANVTARLEALKELVDERNGNEGGISPAERVEMIRLAAQIAVDADALAEAGYSATKTLTGEAWDRALETADMASDHHSHACRVLQAMICGNAAAVDQMESIERRCRAGGF